ncbi:alkene reductase [Terrisporobacter petrolearius]|uniref:alkene reductase n=1 Tax=Terrisporobacter petrolearius TaxID=1460447 RepID=UPI0031CCCC45
MSTIFNEYNLRDLVLKNRIVMAPMTRSRSTQPGDIPNEMMAKYYAQRASAGLIITEATQISLQGKGYSFTPGIYTREQVEGWRKVTEAVHNKGGKIFIQLWHVGRMSHGSLHPDNTTVAPSAIAPEASVWIADEFGNGSMIECPVPDELSIEEINNIVRDYAIATKNAKLAGFDGVEIHAGNGYLLDEFLRSSSNKRADEYGGDINRRMRLVLEVVDAVSKEMGSERVGIRISPHNTSRGMNCPEMIDTVYALVEKLEKRKLCYIHFAEADWDEAPDVPLDFRNKIRKLFSGTIIVAGNYDKTKAEEIINKQWADLVAFGRMFIANVDLPLRLERNLPISQYDKDSLFGGGEKGYIDYPPYID